MNAPNFFEVCAREKLQRGPDWQLVAWELVGDTDDAVISGAVPVGLYMRGARKGSPKFVPPFEKCVVTRAETLARALTYEAETGHCSGCGGKGQAWAGWSASEGDRYRQCKRCDGSGEPPVARQASALGATP